MSFGHSLKPLKESERQNCLAGDCEFCKKRPGTALWSYYRLVGDSGKRVAIQKVVCATCGQLAKNGGASSGKEWAGKKKVAARA